MAEPKPVASRTVSPQNRIAVYLYSLYGGGGERVLVNLIRSFVGWRIPVDLVLNVAKGPYLADLPPEVQVIKLRAGYRKGLFRLKDYLQQVRPLALLAGMHYNNEVAITAKHFARVPTRVVVSEHNTLSVRAKQAQILAERLEPWGARLLYPWADGVVAVSRVAARDLAQVTGLPPRKITTIYNPVVTPELFTKVQASLDHPWFVSGSPPVILGAGRLTAQKNFAYLIRAFAQVRQQRSARLMILGEGPDQAQLQGLVQSLGLETDVSFPGFQTNPYPYMAQAAVFVLSSDWEGLPTVVIEAMALGTPVVATDCPGGSAEILDNGKYGHLVPMGDDQAIAKAILTTLAGNPKPVSPTWLEQFGWEAPARQYLDILGITPS